MKLNYGKIVCSCISCNIAVPNSIRC